MNILFIFLFTTAFIFGQFARIQYGNGVTLLVMDIVAGVFSGYWIIKNLYKKKLKPSFLLIPLSIFLFSLFLSLIFNFYWLKIQYVLISSLYIFRFAAYAGLYFYIREFTERQLSILKKFLLFIIIGTVGIGFFQHVYYPNLRNLFYLGWDDHLYRLFSVFLDPNFASSLFVLFFLYLGSYKNVFSNLELSKKIVLSLLASATAFSIFLTYSRTGYLMLLVGGMVFLLLQKRKRIIFLFIAIVTALLLMTSNTAIEGLNPLRIASSKARIESYKTATNIFLKNPIVGVGFNAYRYAQNRYGYRVSGTWETSHADAGTDNSFLFVLATTGIIGFSAFLLLWYRIILLVYEKVKEGSKIAKVALSSIVAMSIGSFFVNLLFYPFVMAWVWVLIALTERNGKQSEK